MLLVSVGRDLPYLTGYEAMPLERLTMLVVPRDGEATMVVPRLEAPRVVEQPGVFTLLPWDETDDPIARRRRAGRPAERPPPIGDTMWARFLVDLLQHWPATSTRYVRSIEVMNALRMRKDAAEIAALAAAGAAADRVAARLQAGEIPLVGRTEAQVSADISARGSSPRATTGQLRHRRRRRERGVAAPPRRRPRDPATARSCCATSAARWTATAATSPAACSLGEPPAEVAEAYAVLHEAQAPRCAAGIVGTPCEEVDRAARRIIADAGFGEYFIHRTGHGIGMEEHEDPYMVEGNGLPLEPGHAFSVEPGIYLPGRWGMRLEDIVVATDARTAGRERRRPRRLVSVDA